MTSLATNRLEQERKNFRKNRPFGFIAKPRSSGNGLDLMYWNCKIPGPAESPFAGGTYSVDLIFSNAFPAQPPRAVFKPALFHPNIYTEGNVCLSLLSTDWRPTFGVVVILQGLQTLLKTPNPKSPANALAAKYFVSSKAEYNKRVKESIRPFLNE